jgi:hypothetical protein
LLFSLEKENKMATIVFDGVKYHSHRQTGHYYSNKSVKCGVVIRPANTLHRAVWEKHNEPIPDGMIVHHIDHDPANNNLRFLWIRIPRNA